ncbi:anaerobic sulfatase maturase [Buttiauxella sp. B2]|uniref:anaerobic sulfatase maturase n=1 Tax=Buttiauxella sp. B2 TaxID=2587812 RepID=UPI001123CA2F|nr:anaerobic sulfatase maturase [Buttiauxella sp. B2]
MKKSCHVMAKPTGSQCNINCDYCFYLEKSHLYPLRKSSCMDNATLDLFIQQQIDAQQTDEVIFAWQGGEPTLAGIDFFSRARTLQKKYAKGKRIINTLQTNGVLINDKWCNFFREHNFLIGISIDGDEELHDCYRKTQAGKSTHQQVLKAIRKLVDHEVGFNTLTVLHDVNVQHPLRVYNYLKEIGSTDMQFIPLLEREARSDLTSDYTWVPPDFQGETKVSAQSITPDDFSKFMKTIFYHWLRRDIGNIGIQFFEHIFSVWCKLPAQICIFAEQCGTALALEMNGDVYHCDHYVYPQYKAGNIHSDSIMNIRDGQNNTNFAIAKSKKLANECQVCEFKFACYGGCPKHRITPSLSGGENLNYFCSGYKAFFHYAKPYMLMMKSLWDNGISPTEIKNLIL